MEYPDYTVGAVSNMDISLLYFWSDKDKKLSVTLIDKMKTP